ncbi:MAG TPA: adenylate/guanylate cyclase domain-containing protein [Candidatus Binatia bacterium]|nr:adenylate/guanylate cyclase domain-containing protein [Candidatus Binatia bacterium]
MSQVQRKLTTILAADAAGYSSVMETDEVRTLSDLRAARAVFSQFIARHHGRIANTAGDGLIAEFPSVVEAVQCAIEVQRELDANTEGHLRFRIGVHLGDVMVDGDDLLGEGVNLAARLQSMAEPGGILISQQVYDQVQKKLSVGFEYLGEKQPKNFQDSVAVYSVGTNQGAAASARNAAPAKGRRQSRSVSEKRARFVSSAQRFGVILAVLAALDLATGEGWWVQWPALGMALWLAFRSGPMFERAE